MNKKLFLLALGLLAASVVYYFFNQTDVGKTGTNKEAGEVALANADLATGTYTAFLPIEGCKGREVTLELEDTDSAYLTEDFVGCDIVKESLVRGGSWQIEGESLILNLIDNTNQTSTSTLPIDSLSKTEMSFYLNDKKEQIAVQTGVFGETKFVRIWKGANDFLGTLYKESLNELKIKKDAVVENSYKNDLYIWKVISATSSELSTASSTEIYIKQ